MERVVPLVIYVDGERHIIGTAVVETNGSVTAIVHESKHKEISGLSGLSVVGSLGPKPKKTNESLGAAEIEHRFGFHKATIEGDGATLPKHRDLRRAFRDFAEELDHNLPPGRAKNLVITILESASMWAHKAIAETAPLARE